MRAPGQPAQQGRDRRQRAGAGSGASAGLSHSYLLHPLPEAALAGVNPADRSHGGVMISAAHLWHAPAEALLSLDGPGG